MVFPSVPVYLDPHPPNWQQHQGGVTTICSSAENNQQLSPIMPPPPMQIGGGGTSSIRPGSMAERARLAKIPQPETALKCPRCESTNTKFCYFNNYSLSQPRHFCKTCRRYWTRGGALRNVPVGGGCRRNKRSKRSGSKSPSMADHQNTSTSTNGVSTNSSSTTDLLAHLPPPPQLPFFAPLHNFSNFGNAENIGLNFSGIQPAVGSTRNPTTEIQDHFQAAAGPLNLSARFADQWKLHQVQQFPFMSGLSEQPSAGGGYQFEGEAIHEQLGFVGGASDQLGSKATMEVDGSVKLEQTHQGPNLSRNFSTGNDQFWSTGNTWTDLSGSTSAAGHLM